MKKIDPGKLSIAIFFVLLSTFLGGRVVLADDCLTDDDLVITTDTAPILSGDVIQAKNIAVWGAMRKALECKGLRLQAETVMSHGLQMADSTWIEVEGFIKAWELIEDRSGIVGEGYKATVKSWVKGGRQFESEKKNLLSFHKVLFIADSDVEKAVEQTLDSELRNTIWGIRTHDSNYVKNNVNETVWKQLYNRKLYNLDPNAFKFEADLVIHIEADLVYEKHSDFPNYEKYSGNTNIRLFQLSGEKKGEAIIQSSISSDKIFVKNEGKRSEQIRKLLLGLHRNDFVKQVAEPASIKFMESLMNCELFAVPDRTISIVIQDVPSQTEFEKFLYIVKKQRGVNDRVKQVAQKGRKYIINVQFPMKSIYLSNLISRHRQYQRIGHGWNRIEFLYVSQEG